MVHGKQAANIFADTYKEASNIPVEQHKQKYVRTEQRKITESDDVSTVINSPLSYEELTSVLSNLKLKKSPGPDAITNEMIVNLGQPALHKLLDIFNKTWQEGTLPQIWREATMIPIHKKGKPVTIMLDDTELQHTDSATYLGITFDKRQTWKTHISRAEAKARRKLALLRKLAGTQ